MKHAKAIIAVLWCCSLVNAQTLPQSLQLQTPVPPAPIVSANVVGNSGNASYSYYVVVNYPSGAVTSQPANVILAPATLSAGNYINIGWQAMTGASTYDVIRLVTGQPFTGSCTCAVATGLTGTSTTDIGGALASYTIGTLAPAGNGTFYVNNIAGAAPLMHKIVNGVDTTVGSGNGTVTSVATACGIAGGPVTATGTISQTVATAAHNGSYAVLTGDCGKSLTTNTTAAWTIAQAGTTGFEAGKFWTINNVGSGSLTLTATTSTFYGGPTANISGSVLTIPANSGVTVASDGTNYQVLGGSSPNAVTATGTLTNNAIVTGAGSKTVQTVTSVNNAVVSIDGSGNVQESTALPNGTTATTQGACDNSTKVATTAFVATGCTTVTALTDAATVTWAIGSVLNATASLTFTVHSGSRTLNITGPLSAGQYVLKIVQDGTGGEGLTLGTGCTWKVSGGGAGAITPSTGANAIDVLAFYYDGTNCYANFNKNFN